MAKRDGKKKVAKQSAPIAPPKIDAGPPWKWFCFKDHKGNDVIDPWCKSLSGAARGKFSRSRDQLRGQPKQNWSKPQPASNVGDHIYVIRFSDENRMQHRVFGHFHDVQAGFVMTLTGYEKDYAYYPDTYRAEGKDRKSLCDNDFVGRTRRCFDSVGGASVASAQSGAIAGECAETEDRLDGPGVQARLHGRLH